MHCRCRGARRGHWGRALVNIKAFFVATLSSALDLGIATPDDVLRHVTPDVLSTYLPRPLWARLLTAALGAPRVDAQLVVETIGVPNLCEHVPSAIVWACVAEIGQRSLTGGVPAQPISRMAAATPGPMKAAPLPVSAPPAVTAAPAVAAAPAPAVAAAPAIAAMPLVSPPPAAAAPAEIKRDTPSRGMPVATPPPAAAAPTPKPAPDGLADVVAALESDERHTTASRTRTPTGPRFRQNPTGISRLGAINTRRPQAPVSAADEPTRSGAAPTPPAGAAAKPARRGETESDEAFEIEAEGKEDWKSSLAVEDEQLVDWQASESTQTAADEYRKR